MIGGVKRCVDGIFLVVASGRAALALLEEAEAWAEAEVTLHPSADFSRGCLAAGGQQRTLVQLCLDPGQQHQYLLRTGMKQVLLKNRPVTCSSC